MHHLFVYGTLMLKYPANPHRALLEKHCTARFSGWCSGDLYALKSYPAMIPGPGKVYGEILRLENAPELFRMLDEYEGFYPGNPQKSHYLRVETEAFTEDDTPYRCWTYLYNRPVRHLKKLDSGRFF
ncbi:MAG: gamma-glutamylcyclotransferase [Leadbetterella sp.]|nr:gamma-glutamylcyclotransferase [Leadbetterella sp.]